MKMQARWRTAHGDCPQEKTRYAPPATQLTGKQQSRPGRRDLAEASGFKKGSQHKKQLKWEEASTSSLSPYYGCYHTRRSGNGQPESARRGAGVELDEGQPN